jgi:septum formation protein
MRILLASKSPRRKELLTLAGLDFDITESDVDENSITANTPESLALKLAELKAEAVAKKNPTCLVIGADTIVVSDVAQTKVGRACGQSVVLEKPKDKDDAREILTLLSGTDHKVITAFSLISLDKKIKISKAVETIVSFREITKQELEYYLDSKEPYDKAGAYGAQGYAQSFITSIQGSYTSVVGLPLSEVVTEIRGIIGK